MLQVQRLAMGITSMFCVLALFMASSSPVSGQAVAPGIPRHNLAELIAESQRILLARVESVTDSLIDDGVPYTEITLSVTESFKGPATRQYQFRQFGKRRVAGSKAHEQFPEMSMQGFPQWSEGETVLVFLPRPARMSGMQTTIGLTQGKLVESKGRFASRSGIEGIFENLVVEAGDLTSDQIDMLKGEQQTVDATALLDLLRRAIDENWIERGVMHRGDR